MGLKTFLTGLALVLVGLLAIAVTALKSVDFNAYKDFVAQQVKVALGRDLVIAGDVSISIGLRPHLTAKQIILRNASWSDQPQMVALDQIDAGIELLPLLFEQIRLRDVTLSGGQIILERNKEGIGNWAFDGAASNGDTPTPLPDIGKLSIENFKLRYRDPVRRQDVSMVVSKFSARTAADRGPVSWSLDGTVDKSAVNLRGTLGTLSQLAAGPSPVNIRGTVAETGIQIVGTVQNAMNLTGWDVDLQLAGNDGSKVNPLLGLSLPQTQPFKLTTHVTDPEDGYHFDHLQLAVGGSKMNGIVVVAAKQPSPFVRLQVTADRIDLADFGFAPAAQKNPSANTGPIFDRTAWGLDWMRNVDADVALTVRELLRGQPVLKDGEVDLSLRNGVLTLQSLQAAMGNGTIHAVGVVHVDTEIPSLEMTVTGQRINSAPLLAATGLSDVLSAGDLDLDLALNGPATSEHGLMSSLSGTASFSAGSGTLRSSFVRLLLADATKLLMHGGTADAARVSCVAGGFEIDGGVAHTRGVVLDTPGAAVVGVGNIDLGRESLHMRLDSKSKEVSLAALAVPVIVSGDLRHPVVTPDPVGAIGNASDFVAGTADYVSLGALSALTGLGKEKSLGDNPCAALAAGGGKRSSVGDKIKQGADTVGSGAKQAIQGISKGAGSVTKDVGKELGNGLNSLFGN
ncbi:AsmA family protein [Dongia soli]|uniref:AsmA family protein n=1 Tax=Dongia soli TaxID=600628 RepID=A0ABU5EHR8_9PROT|nr:AsmA family protein [Dongia soli]MDY0885852.1 AsmA family protein [Dongia soli]